MRRLPLLTAALLTLCTLPASGQQQQPACAEFQRKVKATYNFKPSRITGAERGAKSDAMDRFWKEAEARRGDTLPCLRAALGDAQADPWFLFDGANLLVALDPSPASKAVQVRQYTAVDLDDVNLEHWVTVLARRGAEGHDVSEAGARWLAHPQATYFLPRHGPHKVGRFEGALYIFGSADEAHATPALLKIVRQPSHPGREEALALLLLQATPESLGALKQLDASGFSEAARVALRETLARPALFTPRAAPKTSRAEFLKAFDGIVNGRYEQFFELVEQVPDGEVDVVAVLKPQDLPLVRSVRRRMVSAANPHAVDYYQSFTKILMTMILKPETAK